MNLTDFLLTRIAEDEAAARAADALGQIADRITTSSCEEFADHIARHDPARVLAECEAKRRIITRACRTCAVAYPTGHCSTLRDLASVYADHPDYRQEWKP